jgi:4-amino-4-deoxy-L-arabinose transferase-like glycosyltransferase
MRHRLPYLLLVGVLVGSFAFHAYRAEHPTSSYQSADERSYGKLAINIADQHHYGDPSTGMIDPLHWPPGAPMLFAAGHALFPSSDSVETYDIPAAYWLQAVLSLGTILAAFGLAHLLAGPWAGLVAAALVGFYPPLILSTGEQLSEPLGAFFLISAFLVLALAARRSLTPLYLAGGALLGLAILTRADLLPVPLVLGPVVAAWTWRAAGELRRGVVVGALIMGGAALAIAPWSIYASERAGELVPVTRGSSSALFVGTYLPGDGTTVGLKRALGAEAKKRNPRLRGIPDFELEARSVLAVIADRHPDLEPNAAIALEARRNVTRYAREDPVGYAGMMLNKVQRMWSRYARGGARHTSAVIRVWHILLVIAAVAGLIAGIARRRSLLLGSILAAILVATAVHMLVVSQARYNLPLMPALIAGGVAGWFLFARGPRRAGPEPAEEAGKPRTVPRPAAERLPSGAASR